MSARLFVCLFVFCLIVWGAARTILTLAVSARAQITSRRLSICCYVVTQYQDCLNHQKLSWIRTLDPGSVRSQISPFSAAFKSGPIEFCVLSEIMSNPMLPLC